MRIGIVGLLHESNTFVRKRTTWEHFEQDLLLTGEAVREKLAGAPHEIGGFFQGIAAARGELGIPVEAVPVFAARALPFGPIAGETFERLLALLFERLEFSGPLDGLLVAAHGAAVSESQPDADGDWLHRLRKRLGPQVPIICTLDLHANLSDRMVAACDAIIAYRSNPHLDQAERGREAARLIVQTAAGEVRPTMAAARPPLVINIERQSTAEAPCRDFYDLADRQRETPDILSNSLILGFPYADVPELGAAAVVVTDNDLQLAERQARELGLALWSHREECLGRLVEVDDALDRAQCLDGPVCLLDMGDNVGGGSPGDGTVLAARIHDRRLAAAFVCLCDPQAVAAAEQAGRGQAVTLRVGGHTDERHGPPLEATFTVLSLWDGRFSECEPRHGGMTTFDQGRTAILRTDAGLTVMASSRRMVPFSLSQLTGAGLDPASFRLLVVKGVHAPLAAYRSVCRYFLRVNTPGVTSADLSALSFEHRRRPLFPFEADTSWPGRA